MRIKSFSVAQRHFAYRYIVIRRAYLYMITPISQSEIRWDEIHCSPEQLKTHQCNETCAIIPFRSRRNDYCNAATDSVFRPPFNVTLYDAHDDTAVLPRFALVPGHYSHTSGNRGKLLQGWRTLF